MIGDGHSNTRLLKTTCTKKKRDTHIFYNFFSSSRFFLVNWVLVRIKIKKKKSVIVLTHKLHKHLRLSA